MKPKGTIFSRKNSSASGETKIALSEFQKKVFKRVRLLGAVLFSFSFTSLLFLYGPSLLIDTELLQNKTQVIASEGTQPVVISQATPKAAQLAEINQFSVNIPAIKANSDVVYNVDPFNKDEYLAALETGVAHAANTGLPGQGRRIFLFAHSTNSPLNFTQFNAVFYQLRLLEDNDEIVIKLNNEEFKYKITGKQVVGADDTHWLTDEVNKEQLILQTCDPPGTSLRRLLVIAERI